MMRVFTVVGLLFLVAMPGCTSALLGKAGEKVASWDRPRRIVAAFHGSGKTEGQLVLVVEGRAADEPEDRQYVVSVPLERVTVPAHYDASDPDASSVYLGWTNIPMFARFHIGAALPEGLGEPIAVVLPPEDWLPKEKWTAALPAGVTEAVAVVGDSMPPVFIYLHEPFGKGCPPEFTIVPVYHQPNLALAFMTPFTVAADVVAAPVVAGMLLTHQQDRTRLPEPAAIKEEERP